MKKLLLILLCLPMIGLGQTQFCCLNGECIENVGNIQNSEDCIWFSTIALCEPNCTANDKWYCKNDWTGVGCEISYYDDFWGTYDFEGIYELFDNYTDCEAACNTTSITEPNKPTKKLKKITDLLGQEMPIRKNTTMFYIYDDGTVEKKIIIE